MSYNKNCPNMGLMGHTTVSKLWHSQKYMYIRSSSYFWPGSERNFDSNIRTFRNCDMTRFEIQMGDKDTPLTGPPL